MPALPPVESILDAIGATPMVRLTRLEDPASAAIFAKLESLNPAGSAMDRLGRALVAEAERGGALRPDRRVRRAASARDRRRARHLRRALGRKGWADEDAGARGRLRSRRARSVARGSGRERRRPRGLAREGATRPRDRDPRRPLRGRGAFGGVE